MSKAEFLNALRNGLSGLPQEDVDERLSFYSEMIDDRIEEGLSEEEAVAAAGSVEDIVSQTVSDIPLTKLVKEKIRPNRSLKTWEIVLIVAGFPVWFPLLIAAGAVIFSLYVVLWALVVSLWAIEFSFAVTAVAGSFVAVAQMFAGYFLPGLGLLGAGVFLAGVTIPLYFGCIAASKGTLKLTKKIALALKTRFIRKENAK